MEKQDDPRVDVEVTTRDEEPEHFAFQPVANPVQAFDGGMRDGFIPVKLQSFREAYQFASTLVNSGLLPKAIKKPGQALAIMLTGQELGIPPMAALRMIDVVEGRPSLSSELMLALFRRAGGRYEIQEHTEKACRITFSRDGVAYTAKWTIEDADRAELTSPKGSGGSRNDGKPYKDNWRKYPKRMLLWRCVDNGLSIVAPDVFLGMHTAAHVAEVVQEEIDPDPDPLELATTEKAAGLAERIKKEKAKGPSAEEVEAGEPVAFLATNCSRCPVELTKDNVADDTIDPSDQVCMDCAIAAEAKS